MPLFSSDWDFPNAAFPLPFPKDRNMLDFPISKEKTLPPPTPKSWAIFCNQKTSTPKYTKSAARWKSLRVSGLAEGICDIVSSGSTLMMNGLKEVEVIFKSEAVLISNNNLNEDKLSIVDKLLFRMNAVQTGKSNKYVLLNAPNDSLDKIVSLIPGMRSPTILPLAQEGWSSVHSVLSEEQFWENIEGVEGGWSRRNLGGPY
jgi:ATP phosphoribosyltransferase